MAKFVVNSRLSFAINFILAKNIRSRSLQLIEAAKRWWKDHEKSRIELVKS